MSDRFRLGGVRPMVLGTCLIAAMVTSAAHAQEDPLAMSKSVLANREDSVLSYAGLTFRVPASACALSLDVNVVESATPGESINTLMPYVPLHVTMNGPGFAYELTTGDTRPVEQVVEPFLIQQRPEIWRVNAFCVLPARGTRRTLVTPSAKRAFNLTKVFLRFTLDRFDPQARRDVLISNQWSRVAYRDGTPIGPDGVADALRLRDLSTLNGEAGWTNLDTRLASITSVERKRFGTTEAVVCTIREPNSNVVLCYAILWPEGGNVFECRIDALASRPAADPRKTLDALFMPATTAAPTTAPTTAPTEGP